MVDLNNTRKGGMSGKQAAFWIGVTVVAFFALVYVTRDAKVGDLPPTPTATAVPTVQSTPTTATPSASVTP